jgi:hypothetical protein
MPTRASKLKEIEETNSAALRIVALTTGQTSPAPIQEKNAAAVALGKLGASKGGIARAASLSAKRKKEIAKQAALKRWKKS